MCGRFRIEISPKDIIGFYRLIEEVNRRYHDHQEYFSGTAADYYPGSDVPVLTPEKIELQNWGFPLEKKLVFNGRSESIQEKRMFRDLVDVNRCIIPATLFYEWHNKAKYTIQAQSPYFFMAGLYRTYREKGGEARNSFVILTTDADKDVSAIHTRMPVILPEDRLKDYLDPTIPYQEIERDIRPWNQGLIVKPAAGEQLSLFDPV